MWLSKPVYEAVPFTYVLGGAMLFRQALLHGSSPALETILVASGVAGVIAGLVLMLKRRAYRSSRSRERFNR
jgi:hypothetical protein